LTRFAALLTQRRLRFWGVALLVLGWGVHIHTMSTPGLIDRAGRFKGSDYTQFYVMGSLAREGRLDALYDPAAHLDEGRARIDPALALYSAYPDYGPQVAVAFAPLATLSYPVSLALFLLASAICYACSVWLVWRECDALRGHGRLVTVLAAASPLFLTVVRYGQASAFALLALSLAFVGFRRGRLTLAGFAIGCLAWKPQLGIVIAVALLAARQWRVIAGALLALAAQLAVALAFAGPAVVGRYVVELWRLVLNPSLVEIYASEVHSIRGFVQLLVPFAPVVTVCSALGLLVALGVAIRSWSSSGPVAIRWALLIVLTVLASPHLLTYDLLLLTLPLLLCADWALQHVQRDDAARASVRVQLALLYFAPFSAMIVARLTGVQASVMVIAALAWRLYQVSTDSRTIVAPRWELGSSQNSTTRGWRSSAA
jgi:glycosyl transferase family 87